MAPHSEKKQQSIASFFSKSSNPSTPPKSTKPVPIPSHKKTPDTSNLLAPTANEHSAGSNLSESDDGIPLVSKRRRSSPTRDTLADEETSTSPTRDTLADEETSTSPSIEDFELPRQKRLRRSASFNKIEPSATVTDTFGDQVNAVHDKLIVITPNSVTPQKVSDRASKYLFSTSPAREDENLESHDQEKRRRIQLHQKFVKKLGKPDSIAEIKRQSGHIEDMSGVADAEADGEGEEGLDDEEVTKTVMKGRSSISGKKAGGKLTPMEKQVLEIKKTHMNTVLVVEVGYKFRFFGDDARIAAKELSIVCIPGKLRFDEHPSEAHLDRFASASIPVHRLHVHVKRLVAAGHKVGVVRQLETAALKAAGDNRNAPFVRKLTNLYTKGTYIDDVEGLEGPLLGSTSNGSNTGFLLCITEANTKGWGNDEKVQVGIVAVQPATGDVIYDDFEDGFMRSEIETRLLHIAPCEFLIVGDLSKTTEKLIQHLSGSKTNVFGDKIRVERVTKEKTAAAHAHSHVSSFYAKKLSDDGAANISKTTNMLDRVLNLSENTTICLSAMITHMKEYGLEHVFDLTKYFQSFSARSHMLLNGNTLTSLEIYQNQTDYTDKGSLFWALDRTKTRFGQRLLRKWVGRPLLDKQSLEERASAIEELLSIERRSAVDKLQSLLRKVKSDLEKSLIRIYYGKCTRPELLTVLQTMQLIANEFVHVKSSQEGGFDSLIINEAIAKLPTISDDVIGFLDKINGHAAKNDDKYTFFRDSEETEDITEHKLGIASVEFELGQHRAVAAEKIGKRKIDYVTVAGIEYLIEVDNSAAQIKKVPASWAKISGTKKVSRFHTPEVTKLIRERDQHKEALAAACDKAFDSLLADISTKYQSFRDCVQALATLDSLLSLAAIAAQPGYVKPHYTDGTVLKIEKGRHPMVEQLLLDTYVPNDTHLSSDGTRALLVTGPNMGGKSSYVRQVALIAIMGQIGSYVPARSATLGMLDAVFTRMGAFDNMMAGESTFMVELSETSDILKQATPRSLVILDELGRGTSTHDGVAIAQSVLDYMVRELKSLTLFITHYQNLATLAKSFEHAELENVHMRFEEAESARNDVQSVTFLYEVAPGVAHRSYGLNVGHLANVPLSVLQVAAMKSKQLEDTMREKTMRSLATSFSRLVRDGNKVQEGALEALISGIEQL